MSLRFDWKTPIARLERSGSPFPHWKVESAIQSAVAFCGLWADYAEMAGMQPAHLLSYKNELGRGLAWRLNPIRVLVFPRKGYLVAEGAESLLVYRFCPDGRTVMVFGKERTEILGSQVQLMQEPSVRMKALMSQPA